MLMSQESALIKTYAPACQVAPYEQAPLGFEG
jgi:hypothetical protein